jgi:predicted component of type VI protein secretion system
VQLMLSRADGSREFPWVLEIPGNPRIESEFLIGRAHDCDVNVMEPSVSRHHCGIVVDPTAQSLRVHDKGSRNGTFVNDQPVQGMCALQDGDKLTVGFVPLRIWICSSRSFWDDVAKRCRAAQIAMPRRIESSLGSESVRR